MNRNIATITNNKFGSVRTINENGEILYSGNDVIKAFGLKNANYTLHQYCTDMVKRDISKNSGVLNALFISQNDIHRLISGWDRIPVSFISKKWRKKNENFSGV